jgi:hypothetical protein
MSLLKEQGISALSMSDSLLSLRTANSAWFSSSSHSLSDCISQLRHLSGKCIVLSVSK